MVLGFKETTPLAIADDWIWSTVVLGSDEMIRLSTSIKKIDSLKSRRIKNEWKFHSSRKGVDFLDKGNIPRRPT